MYRFFRAMSEAASNISRKPTDEVYLSGLHPESTAFLDSRFRGNDTFVAIKVDVYINFSVSQFLKSPSSFHRGTPSRSIFL